MSAVLRGLIGLFALVSIAVLLTENRSAIRLRTVVPALALQIAIGALVLFVPWGRLALGATATAVSHVIASAMPAPSSSSAVWSAPTCRR